MTKRELASELASRSQIKTELAVDCIDSLMDSMVCVYLDYAERLSRLMLRDGTDTDAIRARMASQLPAEVALMRADYVILNYEGNPRHRQVLTVDAMLRNQSNIYNIPL